MIDLEELAARSLDEPLTPDERVALRVWADALEDAGDPRGPLIAMEHALRDQPSRGRELRQAMHDYAATNAAHLLGAIAPLLRFKRALSLDWRSGLLHGAFLDTRYIAKLSDVAPNELVTMLLGAPAATTLRRLYVRVRSADQVGPVLDMLYNPLDILINNAAQTVRRPPAYYASLVAAELAALPPGAEPGALLVPPAVPPAPLIGELAEAVLDALMFPPGLDEEGKPLDLRPRNSWVLEAAGVPPVELVEVHVINAIAPFLLASRLRPLLARSAFADRYVVNVSAMEGVFAYPNKQPRHPHTNMAKAALNMFTRTLAADYVRDGIYMNSVDTGWITQENPVPLKRRAEAAGFCPPLDVVDGAARVLAPVLRGVRGAPVAACCSRTTSPRRGDDAYPLPGRCGSGDRAVPARRARAAGRLARAQGAGARAAHLSARHRARRWRLDLCKQALGPDGARRVLEALRGHPAIRSILFGTGAIGNAGAAAVAAALDDGLALETVYLGCNRIDDEGLVALGGALSRSEVWALWLKRNPLGVAGARRIAELVVAGAWLRVLDLYNCELDDEGVARWRSSARSSAMTPWWSSASSTESPRRSVAGSVLGSWPTRVPAVHPPARRATSP